MSQTRIRLTRAELYEKVWATPMRTLAQEFRMSDVGLAKDCRKHNIPVPPVGYWRRKETGYKVNRPLLRPVKDGPEHLDIYIRERLRPEFEELARQVAPKDRHCSRRHASTVVSLARRPVLFALARALGEAWPGDVARNVLLARAFGARFTDESHRARLRVEIGRLRRMLRRLVDISATKRGFVLVPQRGREVVVLARPVEEEHADVLAFLRDGESWSSSALALALGASQRTVQRALDSLAAGGKVQSFGQARARRWITPPVPGFTTILLLPAPLPTD